MKCVLALLLAMVGAGATAAEVTVSLLDGKLRARVDALAYPASLQKELTSGLTNRLYSRVTLADAGAVLAQKVVETAIRYDLWDQNFAVVTTLDGVALETRDVASLADVTALLAALPLPALFDAATVPTARDLTLRVEVLLNPIDREKMRMIRKWVAQNSTPQAGGDQGVSISNSIFNRIFEQYADGSDVAAAWQTTVTSGAFRIDMLKHERN